MNKFLAVTALFAACTLGACTIDGANTGSAQSNKMAKSSSCCNGNAEAKAAKMAKGESCCGSKVCSDNEAKAKAGSCSGEAKSGCSTGSASCNK